MGKKKQVSSSESEDENQESFGDVSSGDEVSSSQESGSSNSEIEGLGVSASDQESGENESSQESSDSKQQNSESEQAKDEEAKSEKFKSPHISSDLMKRIVERDSPELNQLLDEFIESMDIIHGKLKPVLEKVRASRIQAEDGEESQFVIKDGMSFLEMKYNLMLTYCSTISFYILLKLEGKDVKGHPVVGRLIHLKLLLEKLRPLDTKMQYQVDKMVRTAILEQTDGRQLTG